MRIFLTGGTGFIGKFVIDKLSTSQNQLLILSRHPKILKKKNISFIENDLSKINDWKNTLKNFKPEAAVHLAWEGIPDYGTQTSIKNLNYGLNLTRVLGEVGCKKMLVSGSLWEYGEVKGRVSEDTPIKPFNAFTAAKNSLYLLASEIAREYNMIFLWTRIFYVYGPGQKETSLISSLITNINQGKVPQIRNPNAKNDFIYVEDVADAISLILKKSTTDEIYNIGSGKLTGVKEIIKKIFIEFNKPQKFQFGTIHKLDKFNYFFADISKLKALGLKSLTSIDQGLKKTLATTGEGK